MNAEKTVVVDAGDLYKAGLQGQAKRRPEGWPVVLSGDYEDRSRGAVIGFVEGYGDKYPFLSSLDFNFITMSELRDNEGGNQSFLDKLSGIEVRHIEAVKRLLGNRESSIMRNMLRVRREIVGQIAVIKELGVADRLDRVVFPDDSSGNDLPVIYLTDALGNLRQFKDRDNPRLRLTMRVLPKRQGNISQRHLFEFKKEKGGFDRDGQFDVKGGKLMLRVYLKVDDKASRVKPVNWMEMEGVMGNGRKYTARFNHRGELIRLVLDRASRADLAEKLDKKLSDLSLDEMLSFVRKQTGDKDLFDGRIDILEEIRSFISTDF